MKGNFLKGLTSLLILIFVNFNLQAQDQSIRFMDVGEFSDYSDIRAWDLFQDSRGFIWIGTLSGMDRWDGSRLRSYTMPPFDSLGFPASAVQSLVEDDHNNLWLGTRLKGIVKYDLENEQFTSINNAQGKNPNSNITCLKYDKSGFLWVGALDGLYRYFPEDNRYEVIQVQDSLMAAYNATTMDVMDIEFDSLGMMWITSSWGLFFYDTERNVCKRQIIDLSNLIPDDYYASVSSMSLDSNGIIWMLFGDEVVQFNPYSKAIDVIWPRKYEDTGYKVGWGAIQVDSKGKVWISSNQSITRYDPTNGMAIQYGDVPITEIIEDKDGNIIASSFGGVKILDKSGSQIKNFTKEYLGIDTWKTEILVDKKTLWIGSQGNGVLKLNEETGEKVYYKQNSKAGSLSDNGITKILKDRDNQIWIKTLTGLHLYDPAKDSFKRFTFEYGSVITEGRDKNIWIVDRYNLIRLDPVTFDTLRIPLKQPLRGIASFDVYGFVQDTIGFFWISGLNSDGLIRINPETGESISYRHNIKNPDGLAGYPVKILFFDSKDRMWAGTKTGLSLVHIFPNSDSIYCTNYFVKDGLIGDDIYGLVEDPKGNIWVGTSKGVSILKTDGAIQNLSEEDGIDKPFIWTISSDKKGNIYAGVADIFKIPSNFLQANKEIPPVFITDIQVSGESIYPGDKSPLNKSILFANQIDLKYFENFMRIEFSALNYTHSEKNRYRYILKGVDKDTVNALHKNYAEYTDLKPGKYTFWATGSNNSGLWNTEGKQLSVIIHPPPWATWWAYTIYVALVLAAIWGFIAWRTSEQKKKIRQMKKVEQLKDQFLANTSHELRTPLQGIIGLAESLKDGIAGKLPQKAIENLNMINSSGKRLANLVNDILDFSKLKKHDLSLQLTPVDIHSIVEVVITVLRPLIKNKDIELNYYIPDDLPYVIADENRLQQILHNLLGNAIKFTEKGSIRISAEANKKMVAIKITDTGIGIPKDKQSSIFQSFEQGDGGISREYGGTGLGLSVSRQLIELHGGSIEVESEPGQGSVFTFTLPVSDAIKTKKVESKKELITQHVGEENTGREISEEQRGVEEITGTSPNGKIRILVVDDEPVNLQVLNNHLSLEGYHVTLANSGTEAIDLIKDGNIYDLIILDIMMPKLSGYEVCSKLREIYLPSELPVVMLTAKNLATDLVDGFKTGANDYLTKPFSKDELLSRIKTHLRLNKIFKETGKFVPFDFLHYIGRESIMDVQIGDQANKEVTVLFADIRDYTSLAEGMNPEENFMFIKSFVGMLGPIVTDNKGFVNQYMGDGIMAIFPKEVEHTLDAAIQMQQKISEYNKHRVEKNRQPIKIGIGLHTGPLVMGIIGDKLRSDPATIADSVNTASRLEGMTKHYGVRILLSEDSLNQIKDKNKYHFRFLGKVKLKGKNTVIKVYECIDGDESEVMQKKINALKEFEVGLDHFYQKEFTEASLIFKHLIKSNESDLAAGYYFKLTAKYSHKGVAKDWTGVDRMDRK